MNRRVLFFGLLTTVLALLLAAFTPVMGFYAHYQHIIPIPLGAVLMGLLAGSGYGVASLQNGSRITGKTFRFVLSALLLVFVLTHLLSYLSLRPTLPSTESFWLHFDTTTRRMPIGLPPAPIGTWGYAYRLAECFFFVAGGLFIPIIRSEVPYCTPCQTYRKSITLAHINASPASQNATMEEWEEAEAEAQTQLDQVDKLLNADQVSLAIDMLANLSKLHKKQGLVPQWFRLRLSYCPKCLEGDLITERVEVVGSNTKYTPHQHQLLSPGLVDTLRLARKDKRL